MRALLLVFVCLVVGCTEKKQEPTKAELIQALDYEEKQIEKAENTLEMVRNAPQDFVSNDTKQKTKLLLSELPKEIDERVKKATELRAKIDTMP